MAHSQKSIRDHTRRWNQPNIDNQRIAQQLEDLVKPCVYNQQLTTVQLLNQRWEQRNGESPVSVITSLYCSWFIRLVLANWGDFSHSQTLIGFELLVDWFCQWYSITIYVCL